MKLLQVIELEKRKCNKCKKNYDYVLVGIAIDEKNIVNYLASKYI